MNKIIPIFLSLIFISYPFESFQLFEIVGYGFKANDLVLIFFYAFVLKRMIWDGDSLKVNIQPYILMLGLLIIAILLSSIYPLLWGHPAAIIQYIKTTAHLFFILLLIPSLLILNIQPKDWEIAFKSILVFSMFASIFGVYQIFARAFDLPFAWLEINNVALKARGLLERNEFTQISLQFEKFFRATSIFSEPSAFGAFNSLMLTLMIVPYILRKPAFIKTKWLAITVFSTTIIGSLATFSLTALLSFFGVVATLMFFEGRRFLKHSVVIFLGVTSIIIVSDGIIENYLGTSVVGLFADRVEGVFTNSSRQDKMVSGESLTFRKEIDAESVKIWEKSPIIGTGLGNFYLNSSNKVIFYSQTVFFGTLTETGLIGNIAIILMFLFLFIKVFTMAYRNKSDEIDNKRYLLHIAFYLLVCQFFVNFFTTNLLLYVNLWYYIAFIFYIINYYSLQQGAKFYEIKFVQVPLKSIVANNLNK